jgi:hypothetical protein
VNITPLEIKERGLPRGKPLSLCGKKISPQRHQGHKEKYKDKTG